MMQGINLTYLPTHSSGPLTSISSPLSTNLPNLFLTAKTPIKPSMPISPSPLTLKCAPTFSLEISSGISINPASCTKYSLSIRKYDAFLNLIPPASSSCIVYAPFALGVNGTKFVNREFNL